MANDDVQYGLDGEPLVTETNGPESTETSVLEPVPFPEEERASVEQLNTSLEWLSNLQYTVQRQGVCDADVESVLTLRKKVLGQEVATIALESYGSQLFSAERTGLNLAIANEGIVNTIVDTIKALIAKLIEYVTKAIKWIERQTQDERIFKFQLGQRLSAVKRLRAGSEALIKEFGGKPEKLDKPLNDYARKLLTDGTFPLNAFLAAFMNITSEEKHVQTVFSALETHHKTKIQEIKRFLVEMETILQRDLKSAVPLSSTKTTTNTFARALDELYQSEPDREKFIASLGFDPFGFTPRSLLTEITPYGYLIDGHKEILAGLKRIKEVSESVDVTRFNDAIGQLNITAETINGVVNRLIDLNKMKVQVLTACYKYEGMRFNLLVDVAKDTLVGDEKVKWLEKLCKDVESFVKGLVK